MKILARPERQRLAPPGGDRGVVYAFRHPRPQGAEGRCIGRTDLGVDPRRARRLAHRIRALQRRHGLARQVWTSPLRRCADVGRWLARWGWRHEVADHLIEFDFGRWDGLDWTHIDRAEIDAWCDEFVDAAPGGGESLRGLLERVGSWRPEGPVIVVGHAGWMLARHWLSCHAKPPTGLADWTTKAPAYGSGWRLAGPCRPEDETDVRQEVGV